MKEEMKYAKDYKCDDCGKQADSFFPVFDPDIPSHPYCDKCLRKRKRELVMEMLKILDKKDERLHKDTDS